MKRTLGFALACLSVLMSGGCARQSAPTPNAEAASSPATLALLDLGGLPMDPFRMPDPKAIVFLFVTTDCPISNRYAPEMRRLEEKFHAANVKFWLVYPDPSLSVEQIENHLRDYQFSIPALRDPKHTLVKRAGARVTPEAAVFTPKGQLLYHGRIDNRYVDFGKERPAPTQRDLQDVLEAVISGRTVTNAPMPAVGCYISELR